jgi:hypothetical protein
LREKIHERARVKKLEKKDEIKRLKLAQLDFEIPGTNCCSKQTL